MPRVVAEDWPQYPWELAGGAGSWSWNASTSKLTLLSRKGDPEPQQIHPEDLSSYLERIEQAVRERTPWDFEYRCLRPDHTTRNIESIAHPVLDAAGRLVEYLGIELDITDRKRTAEALRESEARFRTFVDHAADAFFLHDNDDQGRILDVNRQACESLGYTRDELIGKTAMAFDNWLTPDQLIQIATRVIAGEVSTFETRHTRKDGTDFPVEIHIRPFFHGDKHLGLSLARDITERKQAERALNESHDLLRAVIEGTPDAIYAKDLQRRYRMINSAGARFLGKSVAEVLGKETAELVAPETEQATRDRELRILVTAETETFEETVTVAQMPRTFLSTKAPYRDHNGNVIGLVGIARDVTEMKRLEADLRQAQKMEAVGRLAGGVAHDFNNLLSVIIGYSELVYNQLSSAPEAREHLYQVMKAGERAAGLTRQLLAFSRKQVLQPRVLALDPMLAELCKMLKRLIGENITLAQSLDAKEGNVKVDRGQLEQAVVNLAVNARDAMQGGGRLTIASEHVRIGEQDAAAHREMPQGDYVVITVADTGEGLDETTRARIFEPFFTTKEAGKGTGLGLAMVYGFVKQSGGHIDVQSEPGQGTSFHIFLPRVESEETASAPAAEDFQISGGDETILLVEDEEGLRTLLRLVLQSYGYTVLEARDGQDGLWMAGQYTGKIHALVTDLVMPRMGGRELADHLTRQRPTVRTLFVSGHTEDPILQRGHAGPGTAFVHKPFSPLALARKVRQLLDESHDR